MKTAELNASVTSLSTAATDLSASIDRAVAVLSAGSEVTPDADVVAAISAIDAQSAALNTAKGKLNAVLPPVTP